MNVEEIQEYCLLKKGVTESFPFDNVTLVFKVSGKMFALMNLDGDLSVNLKCDPDKAIELREEYPAVLPGFHMHKRHWNTIHIDGSVSPRLLQEWITDSYNLVVSKMSKKLRDELQNM